MSTSGVTTWQLTADELINAALRKIAAISSGATASTSQRADALQALNAMLKTFQVKGMPLWAIKEYTFPLTATKTYSIGVGQTLNTPAPLKLIQAYRATGDISVPLEIRTRDTYNTTQPTSTSTGTPVHLTYFPGLQVGTIKLWPVPDTTSIADTQITIVYQRPFEDMVGGTDNLDFPQFWQEAVIYGLAVRLSPEFGVPIQDRAMLKAEAKEYLDEALSFGTEEGSMYIQPVWEG